MKWKIFRSIGALIIGAFPAIAATSCVLQNTWSIGEHEIAVIDLVAKTYGRGFYDEGCEVNEDECGCNEDNDECGKCDEDDVCKIEDKDGSIEIMAGDFVRTNGLRVDVNSNKYGYDWTHTDGIKYEAFATQIRKMTVGETKIITIVLPTYWYDKPLAGRKIYIKVKIVEFDYKRVEMHSSITIDFEGRAGAKNWDEAFAFQGGSAHSYDLSITGHSFVGPNVDQDGIQREGFEQQLMGMKIGEEKILDIAFPPEYHVVELRGQHAFFRVKIINIR